MSHIEASMARQMNMSFIEKLGSPAGVQEANQEAGGFIRDRLREQAYVRTVLPPQRLTRADLQVSVQHDQLVKIVFLEPRSRAATVNFRGDMRTNFIRGAKAEAAFFTIMSEKQQKTEQELLSYDFPITKVIEDNLVKDIGEIEDRVFTINIESCVQAMQVEKNGGSATALNMTSVQAGTVVEYSVRKGELARNSTVDDAYVWPIQKKDVIDGKRMISRRRLKPFMMLLTEPDYDNVSSWTIEDTGFQIPNDTTTEGFKSNMLCSLKYIRTIKTDILREGNVYFFTEARFFGHFFVLNDPKFYVDKVLNMISFQTWEDISMILANVQAVVKVELYSADASTVDIDGLRSNFLPVSEEDLGALNNRVDQGVKFPNITASF